LSAVLVAAGLSFAFILSSAFHAEANPGLCTSSEVSRITGWDCETPSLNLDPGQKACTARFNCRTGGTGEVKTNNVVSGGFSLFQAQSGPTTDDKRSFASDCGQAVDAYCRGQYD